MRTQHRRLGELPQQWWQLSRQRRTFASLSRQDWPTRQTRAPAAGSRTLGIDRVPWLIGLVSLTFCPMSCLEAGFGPMFSATSSGRCSRLCFPVNGPQCGGLRRLTFELRRARRRARLAVRPRINHGGRTAKCACRRASALERGVRPHSRRWLCAVHSELAFQERNCFFRETNDLVGSLPIELEVQLGLWLSVGPDVVRAEFLAS